MFTGSIVALVTPMDQKGDIDKKSLKHLVDYHIKNGTSAIVSVGTTGESATLNPKEHIDVIKYTVEYAENKINVIAGTGANSTAEAISLTQRVNDLGVIGCLSVTPYYNKPTQEGLYQHFKAIAQSTKLPQILYNVPGRTGCDLLPDTVAKLAQIENIVALKDATGDLKRVYHTRKLVGDKFKLLSGDDATFFEFIQLGGDGVISVTANIAASEMAQICNLIKANQIKEARKVNDKLTKLHDDLFVESNPIPVKWACHKIGLIEYQTIRLPMTILSHNATAIVEKALKIANLM